MFYLATLLVALLKLGNKRCTLGRVFRGIKGQVCLVSSHLALDLQLGRSQEQASVRHLVRSHTIDAHVVASDCGGTAICHLSSSFGPVSKPLLSNSKLTCQSVFQTSRASKFYEVLFAGVGNNRLFNLSNCFVPSVCERVLVLVGHYHCGNCHL